MLFIDAQNAGISGDMIIAALLDMGADFNRIDETLLPIRDVIGKYDVHKKKVSRGVYEATWYRFTFSDLKIPYSEAKEAIKKAGLSKKARDFANRCFETLANAESKIHGIEKEKLHLHDVADTISDFTVSASLLDDMDLLDARVLSSPVNTGKGFFTFHGQRSTLPAPATAEILKGKPLFGDAEMELTTPTGASILVNLADNFVKEFPAMKIKKIGYGAGYKDLEFPNVLKLYLGEEDGAKLKKETIALLETNVDTTTGEIIGYLFDRLFEEGALDVVVVPCTMKKNRPGNIIKVFCNTYDSEKLSRIIMEETDSLGVRVLPEIHRHVLERKSKTKNVKIKGKKYAVRFKTASDVHGKIVSERPEFEDLKRIARKTGLSIKDVKDAVS